MKKNFKGRYTLFKPFLKCKTLRITIMLATLLIYVSSFQLQAADTAIDFKVTVRFKNASFRDVIAYVESHSKYRFFYNNRTLNSANPVTISLSDVSMDKAILVLLREAGLSFKIFGEQVVLKRKRESNGVSEVFGISDLTSTSEKNSSEVFNRSSMSNVDYIISGKVTSETGESLPGVNVVVKGTTIGTTTDSDGFYRLSVKDGSKPTLVFSFIGYKPIEIQVTEQTVIDVSMEPDVEQLREVVVVGYGTQEKKDITGSVSSVSQQQIQDLPVSSLDMALKGQISGVQVFQNSGAPEANVTIRIRGNGSITAGNDPLYVVDGFPVTGGSRGLDGVPGGGNPLNTINPADIESIDILKDASATAIYGSRGANGVIIITTKTGKSGKGKIAFDTYTSIQNSSKRLDVLNAAEFAELHIESRENGWIRNGGDPGAPNSTRGRFAVSPIYFDESQWRVTDWQDEIFRTGIIQNYNLSATGGNDNIRYAISGGYFKNEGIIIESALRRYSFRTNIDAKINEKLNVGLRFSPSYTINNGIDSDGHFSSGSVLGMAIRMPPLISPYLPDGSYENPLALRTATALGSIGAIDNPVAKAKEDQYDLEQTRVLGSIFLEYQLLPDLKFRTSLGIDANFNRIHRFLSSKTGRSGAPPPSVPSGSASSSQELEWLSENLLTYEKIINEKNSITAIAGFSVQKNDYRFIQVNGTNFPNDNVQYIAAAGTVESGTESRNQSSLLSYYARVNYAFDDRYLITATLRRDGSSRFGEENKYGIFPSAALGWRMSEEGFMKNIPFITNFKWRLSYGVSGNNGIPNYAYVPNVVNNGYVLGTSQALVNGTHSGRLANPYITWETARSFNLGADIGILDNRVEFTADVYKSNTDGLLLSVNIPAVSGFGTSLENIGEIENKGLELAVNSHNLTGSVKWDTRFNISFNRNKVISLGGSAGDFIDVGTSRTVVGKPLGMFYMRVTDGIFNSVEEINSHVPQDNNPQPGDRRFKDVNEDGRVNNNDLEFVGNPNPDFTFGFINNFSFKGFELNVLMNGSYGNDIYYRDPAALNLNGNVNNVAFARDRWRSPENPGSGNIPKAVFGFTTLTDVPSDFYVMDGSFLRLTNVTLAYNISKSLINKIPIQNARIYVSGQNLLTLTTYPGYDPETGASGGNPLSQGIDEGIYPISKVYTLGLNLTF